MNEKKAEIAQLTRDAIASVPPFDGIRLEVNEASIYGTDINNRIWWNVPVRAIPAPRLRFAMYEMMAEIEGILQDDRGLDIHLIPDALSEPEATEVAAK